MLLAGVILHRSRRLCAGTAEALIERVDALHMWAVVTKEDNAIGIFANCVHGSSLLSPLLHRMCSIEQTRDDLLGKLGQS